MKLKNQKKNRVLIDKKQHFYKLQDMQREKRNESVCTFRRVLEVTKAQNPRGFLIERKRGRGVCFGLGILGKSHA